MDHQRFVRTYGAGDTSAGASHVVAVLERSPNAPFARTTARMRSYDIQAALSTRLAHLGSHLNCAGSYI